MSGERKVNVKYQSELDNALVDVKLVLIKVFRSNQILIVSFNQEIYNPMFFSPSLRSSDSNWNPDDKAHFNISLCLKGLDQSPLNEALCRLPQEPLPSVLVLMVCLYFNKSFVQRLQCLGNADSVDVILFKIIWWSCQNFVF